MGKGAIMKKYLCTLLVIVLIFGLFVGTFSAEKNDGDVTDFPSDYKLDGTNVLWDVQINIAKKFPGLSGDDLANAMVPYPLYGNPDNVGDPIIFWNLMGEELDTWYQVNATCQAVGTHCYVYVEDAEWYQPVLDGTMNEVDYAGNGYITQADVDAVINTFDNTIYPIESVNFRIPPTYNGEDKITIFLTDIKDGWTGGAYYGGYFYSIDYDNTNPHSNNRHMINIDTYPHIHYPDGPTHDVNEAMGTIAHEYQHLLHFWSDPDETTWINEGQSDYAEFLTMGTFPESHLGHFMAFHSVNLEIWDSCDVSVLENYGASFLFMLYLYENFGGNSIMSLIHNDSINGRQSISNNLLFSGTTFEEVYKDWTLANLLDNPYLYGPNSGAKLGYTNLDIPSEETWYFSVINYLWGPGYNWDYGSFPFQDLAYSFEAGYPSPDIGYWGDTQQQLDANYFIYTKDQNPSTFFFEFLGNGHIDANTQFAEPSAGVEEWYSGSGNGFYDGQEHVLTKTFDFSGVSNPQMTIDTWIDIEYGWDFGYVEASTDGGVTWTHLQDTTGHMTTYRDAGAYVGTAGAYAFTGENLAWVYDVNYDLSGYANSSDVKIRFAYCTDDGYAPLGWIIDNIRITDGATVLLNGSDESDATWTSTTWALTDTIYLLDWTVYVVGYPVNGVPSQSDIFEMQINPLSGDGFIIPGLGSHYDKFVIVPSLISEEYIGGHYPYLHRGYTSPLTTPIISALPVYKNTMKKTEMLFEDVLSKWLQAEEDGKDLSGFESIMDNINAYIINSGTGPNWIYRTGQLAKALNELQYLLDKILELN